MWPATNPNAKATATARPITHPWYRRLAQAMTVIMAVAGIKNSHGCRRMMYVHGSPVVCRQTHS